MSKVLKFFVQALFTFQFYSQSTAGYETALGYNARKIGDVVSPRGLFLDPAGDIFVVSKGPSSIFVLTETETEGEYTRTLVVDGTGLRLTHGLTYYGGYIYASSVSAVYRWAYASGSRQRVTTEPETVIHQIPTGGHSTRTLLFDTLGKFYVSVGSDANVDPDSERARIRRFQLDSAPFPIDFNSGEVGHPLPLPIQKSKEDFFLIPEYFCRFLQMGLGTLSASHSMPPVTSGGLTMEVIFSIAPTWAGTFTMGIQQRS